MYVSRKLAFNSIVLFMGNVVSAGFSFIVSIYLARFLGPGEYGRYSVVFAYISFFHVLTGTGIDAILIREASVDPDRTELLVNQAVLLRSVLSIAAVAVSWVVLPFMGYDPEVGTWVHVASLGLLFSVRSVFSALFQTRLRVLEYTLPEIGLALIFNTALIVAIFGSAPVILLVALQTVNLACLALAFFSASRFRLGVRFLPTIDRATCRRLLSESLPLCLALLFISLMLRIDQLLIYRILGSAQLGLYSAAVRISEAFILIPAIYSTVVYPVMCSAHASSPEYFRKVYRRSMKYMGALSIPLAFGATLLSGEIVGTLFGDAFLPAAGAFAWLMWTGVFAFLGTIYGNALNAMGMQRYVMLYSGVGLVLNIVLNLLLIPRYGIAGAAIASLNSYGGVAFLIQLADRRVRPYASEFFRASAVPVVASCVMTGILYILGGKWSLWFQIVTGGGIYFLTLYLLHFLDAEDKEYLRQIFLGE